MLLGLSLLVLLGFIHLGWACCVSWACGLAPVPAVHSVRALDFFAWSALVNNSGGLNARASSMPPVSGRHPTPRLPLYRVPFV
eukprot:6193214-Pleurochrysis_carterae.AAC.1